MKLWLSRCTHKTPNPILLPFPRCLSLFNDQPNGSQIRDSNGSNANRMAHLANAYYLPSKCHNIRKPADAKMALTYVPKFPQNITNTMPIFLTNVMSGQISLGGGHQSVHI